MNGKNGKTVLMGFIVLIIVISVIIFPEDAFNAAVAGLNVWWNVVFPALLPFFILAQLMIGFGMVHFMGVILEPVMRPVFNVPGSGSFVMAMGLASGFPIGSILTTQLRKNQLCSKVEAERLISFTNTADPLFMFGAVAVGMMGYPQAGIIIALAHYFSSISVGLAMRFYGRKNDESLKSKQSKNGVLKRAFNAMIHARNQDGRPPGQLMGDSILKSVETLMLIGGFIILFSVILAVLDKTGIAGFMSTVIVAIIEPLGISSNLAPAVFQGIFEIDLGCQAASNSGGSLIEILIICSFIIAWSGLSVHAQVASIISETDISIKPYLLARILHGVLAGVFAAILAGPLFPYIIDASIPAFYSTIPSGGIIFWWERTVFMLWQFSFFFIILFIVAICIIIARKISNKKTFILFLPGRKR